MLCFFLQLDTPTLKTELLPMHSMASRETARLLRGYPDEDDLMEHANLTESRKWSQSKICTDCFGVITVLFKLLLFTISVASIQALQGSMPYFELTLFRYLAQVFLMVFWFLTRKTLPKVEKRLAIYVFFACVFSNTYNISFSIAATYLPTGTLGAVFRTLCLLFGAFFSKFVAKEKVGKIHIASMFMHVVGAVCLLEPGFLFRSITPDTQFNIMGGEYTLGPCVDTSEKIFRNVDSNNTNSTIPQDDVRKQQKVQREIHVMGLVLVFVAALTLSMFQTLTKMKLAELNPSSQSLWNAITGTVASAILMVSAEEPILPSQLQCLLYMVGYAVGMAGACVALTCSLRLISTIVSALLDPIQLVLLFVVQYTILENIHPGHRNWLEVLGALLIIIGGMYKTTKYGTTNSRN